MIHQSQLAQIKSEIKPDFSWVNKNLQFRKEFVAGFISAILTIPQAITFSYLAGLPPEYGLYCAVYTTLIASLLGSSMMVGGPNAAVSMLLGVAVLPFAGAGSPLFINFIFILSFMVGIIELLLWISRASRILQYFSPLLISSITTGVGFLILFYSLDGLIGTTGIQTDFFYEKLYIIYTSWDGIANHYAFIVGLTAILVGLLAKRRCTRYYILIALSISTFVGVLLNNIYGIPTVELDLVGYTPLNLFEYHPISLDWEYISIYIQLAGSAFIIALIAISQAMIIINGLKPYSDTPISGNKDIYAQGIANISSVFFGAFCGGGSFNRTCLNRTLGSRSKLATILSCFFIVLLINVFSDFIAYIPMATMSGLLFLVGLEMIKIKTFKQALKRKDDAVSFFVTLGIVILFGLGYGVLFAFIFSVLIFIHRVSKLNICVSDDFEQKICTVKVRGCLFFGTIDDLLQLFREHSGCHLRLDLRYLNYIGPGPARFIMQEQEKRTTAGKFRMEVISPIKWCAGFPELLDK